MTIDTHMTIPLNKLVPFIGNVRKTQNKPFLAELAASIKAHGLQQNLIVKKEGRKFAVVAGGQRLKALQQLAKAGEIKAAHPVPCKIAEGDIDPIEISLLENAVRDDMHPADLFEAFRALVDKGVSEGDIAARFGRSVQSIRQLLKLARVSAVILKAYRAGSLNLEQVMAFAVSDDHAAQEHVLENLKPYNSGPRTIREALTIDEIAATDRRVKFVTLKAYEKAGGKLRADLFREGADSFYILDLPLLEKLVSEKLARITKSISGENWKWTEAQADFGHEQKAHFQRIQPTPAPLSPKLAAKAEALEAELASLRDEWYESEDEDAEEPARIGKIEARLAEIEEGRGKPVWLPEQLAIAGTVVTIRSDGKAEILRGLVRPEDMPKKKAKKAAAQGEGEAEEPQATALSASLVEDLTAQKSAALGAALAQRPEIALAATVHALASSVVLNGSKDDRALQLAASPQTRQRAESSKALAQMDAAREQWLKTIPGDQKALWAWCLKQKQEVLLKLLAFCTAATVNAVRGKHDRADCERLQNADALAVALKLDMKEWFTPDAPNYFVRVGKTQILDALKEGRKEPPAPAWEKLKKAELAAVAERELAGKGWLPEVLRPAA
jgi:ParB family chromosome partitioning protein